MKRDHAVFAFVVAIIAAIAWASPPTSTGIWLDQAKNYSFANCPAVGSAIQVIPNGKYMTRVMEADINVVFDTGYDGGAANNRPMPMGLVYLHSFFAADGGTPVACQSADGGGDLYLTATH